MLFYQMKGVYCCWIMIEMNNDRKRRRQAIRCRLRMLLGYVSGFNLLLSVAASFIVIFTWSVPRLLSTWIVGCSTASTRLGIGTIVHVSHLEDDLECRVENFVQALLLLGGADDEALEGVLLGGRFDLGVGDAFAEFGLVAGALELLAQIKLGADQDARALPGGCLDLGDPLFARVL